MSDEPFVPQMLKQAAARIGARVELEPEFKCAGRVIFNDGGVYPFCGNYLNVNRAGSTAVCADKNYTSHFLKREGFRTPEEMTFFSDRLCGHLDPDKARGVKEALEFARRIGYPVIVKPNEGSCGEGVARADSGNELALCAQEIFHKFDVALIQRPIEGRDYRLLTFRDKVVCAYERRALSVTGDGSHDVRALIEQKARQLARAGRPFRTIHPDDPRIIRAMKRQDVGLDSTLPLGRNLRLLDNCNLSSGGEGIDVTETLHPALADIATRAARALDLTLCGVDVICPDAASEACLSYTILELNGAPGLRNYAGINARTRHRVENLYVDILAYLRDCG